MQNVCFYAHLICARKNTPHSVHTVRRVAILRMLNLSRKNIKQKMSVVEQHAGLTLMELVAMSQIQSVELTFLSVMFNLCTASRNIQQDREYTMNVAHRRVRVTIVAVGKQ